jgi:glutamine amidotransferase
MGPEVAVIDYGMGNLRSVVNALAYLGASPYLARRPEEVSGARGVILPGVGAFGEAARRLGESGMLKLLEEIRGRIPLLGICLGLQLLYEGSEEAEGVKGLGFLPGKVRGIRPGEGRKVPHMGWNQLFWEGDLLLLRGVAPGSYFYFVHSYAPPAEEEDGWRRAYCVYGEKFTALLEGEGVFGCQFHPEKSGKRGLEVLSNFLRLL